ncbi:hypothetical protein DC366_13675 [Pelagivirga sediminicola]|uniref:Glycosyl-4,4'-diaponeurosporenoate acyltransferase n=1 Tax=Pelagivirga sediminicola TaxID=2170575 RepID=A0A2T7G4U7_9RHOB|nr:hypothetical protein [Pelagivirga sediminicola]PVA09435.1 hypothetical protein DC366_13675 [Pelagivirga sediminicola]
MIHSLSFFVQQTAALIAVMVIFSLPAYLFLSYCWRLNFRRGDSLGGKADRLDWPEPGNPYGWKLKHQWRVAIYGPPKQGGIPDAIWLRMASLHRLSMMVLTLTYVVLAILCIGSSPAMLIPLLAGGAWVLIRTPNWPESARKTG